LIIILVTAAIQYIKQVSNTVAKKGACYWKIIYSSTLLFFSAQLKY